MSSMTFQINDQSTETTYPAVWVTITDDGSGTLNFTVSQQGGLQGDLVGLYFDVANPALETHLVITPTSDGIDAIYQGHDSIDNVSTLNKQGKPEGYAQLNGIQGVNGFDVGMQIGINGIPAGDDYQSVSFNVSSNLAGYTLTLADFTGVDFGARLQSLGLFDTDGNRLSDNLGSAKLVEHTTTVIIDATDHSGSVIEPNGIDNSQAQSDGTASGNVLDDAPAGINSVVSWSGGAVGDTASLDLGGGLFAGLTLNSDGSWTLDATGDDALSAGESFESTFDFTAQHNDETTSWSQDSASLTVTVIGANDGPTAVDDNLGVISEGGSTDAYNVIAGRDRKSTRLNSSHIQKSRMPSSA